MSQQQLQATLTEGFLKTPNSFYPLSANPTKWSNTLKIVKAIADELFECVWQFCGIGA